MAADVEERDGHLLDRAAHEAGRAGWLWTAPNPRVGALALKDGYVVGRGCHERYGGPHAEEAALRDAGAWDEVAGMPVADVVDEMIVTLEPCSSSGPGKKRPACTELLLAAGVRRVLVGARDPDPRHAGAGLERLRAEGVQVEVADEGQAEFEALNTAFLRALSRPERPWVLLKWAASLDGKTASDTGASQWITNDQSRAEVHELRASCDAVFAGKGTLRADDPALTARTGQVLSEHQPLRVMLDPDGATPRDARVFHVPGPRLWLLAENAEPAGGLLEHLQADNDRVLRLPRDENGRLDLTAALGGLRAEFGVRRLLVEGGPRLHGALLDAGLVDAVVRYEAPLLLGGHTGALLGRGFPAPEQGLRLAHEERADHGADLRRAFQVLDES